MKLYQVTFDGTEKMYKFVETRFTERKLLYKSYQKVKMKMIKIE